MDKCVQIGGSSLFDSPFLATERLNLLVLAKQFDDTTSFPMLMCIALSCNLLVGTVLMELIERHGPCTQEVT